MKYTENALNILTVLSYNGIGNAWVIKNLLGGKSVEAIVSLLNQSAKIITNVQEFESRRKKYEEELLEKFDSGDCDGVVAWGDKNFPLHRGEVKAGDKPVFLYYKGNLDLLSHHNITVIGLLTPEGDIEQREREIVAEFVKERATIVSGLARGCDTIAHQQALDSNGNTIAILPSPLDNIMPAQNRKLAYQIVEQGGLIITEYGTNFKDPKELTTRYIKRDRLQALFCDTIVLVASYSTRSAEQWKIHHKKLDSGARLAMNFAKEYGIPRAVMYDPRTDHQNPMFDLNRELIEQEKIITLTQDNYTEMVKKIMQKISTPKQLTFF